jgi:hypothetical protein
MDWKLVSNRNQLDSFVTVCWTFHLDTGSVLVQFPNNVWKLQYSPFYSRRRVMNENQKTDRDGRHTGGHGKPDGRPLV